MSNNENELVRLNKELLETKQEIRDIAFKVDLILEILNNFTIMLAEDENDGDVEDYDEFDSDESWVPKEDDFWDSESD